MNLYIKLVALSLLVILTAPVLAESAPVYDADSLPPFDQGADQGASDLPPPPAPSAARQESRAVSQENSGFVPMQSDQSEQADAFPVEPRKTQSAAPAPASVPTSTAERLRRLEQQVTNLQAPEKNSKIDSLQSQNQALRSELDQLNHQVQQLQKQLKTQSNAAAQKNAESSSVASNESENNTTSESVAKKPSSESKAAKPAKAKAAANKAVTDNDAVSQQPSSGESTQPNVQEEQQIYQTAYNLIKSKKYAEAIASLKDMLKKYPSGQFASNAHYWLGELYGLSGKNDQALSEFQTVVKNYSESPRVAEAQLKVGLIFATQSKWSDAKTALKSVVTHYPGTTSARLASEQLKQIKQAGH